MVDVFFYGDDKMERINKYLDHVEDLVETSKDKKLGRLYNQFVEEPTLGNFRRVVGQMDHHLLNSKIDEIMSSSNLKQVETYLNSVYDYIEKYNNKYYADAYNKFYNSPTLKNLESLAGGVVKYGFMDKIRNIGGRKQNPQPNVEDQLINEIDQKLVDINLIYAEVSSITQGGDKVETVNIGSPMITVETPSQVLVLHAMDLSDSIFNTFTDAGNYLELGPYGPATGYDYDAYKLNLNYISQQPADKRVDELRSLLDDINRIMVSPEYKTFSNDYVMSKIINEYKYFVRDFKQYMNPDDAKKTQDVMRELNAGVGYVYTIGAYKLFVDTIKYNAEKLLTYIPSGQTNVSSVEILEYLKMG